MPQPPAPWERRPTESALWFNRFHSHYLLLPTEHYRYLVVLDYNLRQPQPSAGSCIFLHVAPPPGSPTAGCTALAEADLLTLLRWISPKGRPLLVQLPRPVFAAASRALGLPALPGQ